MFVVTEGQLRGLIAPITPFYGSSTEWLNLEEGSLSTFSDIYRTQPAVRSVIQFVSGHLGRMPLKLFKQQDGAPGDEGPREHLRKHPLQKLLNVPNGHKRVGRTAFWSDAWLDFLMYDRMCLIKIKDLDNGDPIALVRVPPVWFTPVGKNYWWPEGIRITGNRGQADFPIEDCVYIHGYDPVDPRIGVSPLATLRSVLEEESAGVQWRKRFWEQGAQPTMIVSRPETAPDWDDGARDRFIESLRSASNRGKPLLLEEGMTTNAANNFNPKATEYLASKKFMREEVLKVYNLPVGLFEQGSASNIGQYRAMLYSESFGPLLSRWVDELETQLLTDWSDDPYDEGLFLEPAIDERLRGDVMSQIQTLSTAAGGAAFMTRKEVRSYLYLKDLADDQHTDVLIQKTSEGLADGSSPPGAEAAAPAGAPAGPPGRPPTGNVDKPTADSRDQSQHQTPTTTGGAPSQKTHPSARTKARADRVKAQFVGEVTDVLQKFVVRQRAAVMSTKGAKIVVPFDRVRWNRELKADLLREKTRITNYYGSEIADEIDDDWDEERVANFLDTGAEYEAKGLNSKTEEYLRDAKHLDDVGKWFDGLRDQGMPSLARDTVSMAKAFGAYEAAKQSGRIVKKIWNTLSGNPRPTHEAQDGEERLIEETFTDGLLYPHDPSGSADETAGCTCEIAIAISDAPSDEGDET